MVMNIKIGFECYNLLFAIFLIYFPEQQSPSNCAKPIIVYYRFVDVIIIIIILVIRTTMFMVLSS